MSLRQYELAIKDWQKFLEFEPDAADVINTIGLCYRMLGKNQEALGYINRAIQMLPDPAFFLNRSYAYNGLGDKASAKRDAMEAKRLGANVDANYAASLGIQ